MAKMVKKYYYKPKDYVPIYWVDQVGVFVLNLFGLVLLYFNQINLAALLIICGLILFTATLSQQRIMALVPYSYSIEEIKKDSGDENQGGFV